VRWVREHLPRQPRIKIGQESAWYEADVLAFMDRQRDAA
jgi:predicted DNA-binding transcriptional regulator AlpA